MLLICPGCGHRYEAPVTVVREGLSFACRKCGTRVDGHLHLSKEGTGGDGGVDGGWYVVQGGAMRGPMETTTLIELAEGAEVRPESLVWRPGMPDWSFAGMTPPLGKTERDPGKWWLKVSDADLVIRGLECVLESDPSHEVAQAGLRRFVESGRESEQAARILEPVLRSRRDWRGLFELLEHRLASCRDAGERHRLRWELGTIALDYLSAPELALDHALESFATKPTEEGLGRLLGLVDQLGASQEIDRFLLAVIADKPDHAMAKAIHGGLARIYELRGDLESALEHLNHADLDESARLAYVRLYEGLERWSELGQFLSDEADHFVQGEAGNAHVRAARLWGGRLQDPFKATAHWRQALGFESHRAEAEFALFELAGKPRTAELCTVVLEGHFERRGDLEGLERVFKLGLDVDALTADQAEAAVRVASILAKMPARQSEARHWSGQALLAAPTNVLVWEEFLTTFSGERATEDAFELLTQGYQNPQVAQRAIDWCDRRHEPPAEAEPLFMLLFEAGGVVSPRAGQLLEVLFRGQRRWSELADLLAARAARKDDDLERAALLAERAAVMMDHLDDLPGAFEVWEEICRLRPNDPDAYHRVVKLARLLGEWGRESAALLALVELETSDSALLVERLRRLATLHTENLPSVETAERAWTSLRSHIPGDADSFEALAELFANAERWEPLRALLEDQLKYPEQADRRDILIRLGRLWIQHLDEPDVGRMFLEEAKELSADKDMLLPLLREAHENMADWVGVAECIRWELEDAEADAETRLTLELADLLTHQLGDAAGAAALLGKAFVRTGNDREYGLIAEKLAKDQALASIIVAHWEQGLRSHTSLEAEAFLRAYRLSVTAKQFGVADWALSVLREINGPSTALCGMEWDLRELQEAWDSGLNCLKEWIRLEDDVAKAVLLIERGVEICLTQLDSLAQALVFLQAFESRYVHRPEGAKLRLRRIDVLERLNQYSDLLRFFADVLATDLDLEEFEHLLLRALRFWVEFEDADRTCQHIQHYHTRLSAASEWLEGAWSYVENRNPSIEKLIVELLLSKEVSSIDRTRLLGRAVDLNRNLGEFRSALAWAREACAAQAPDLQMQRIRFELEVSHGDHDGVTESGLSALVAGREALDWSYHDLVFGTEAFRESASLAKLDEARQWANAEPTQVAAHRVKAALAAALGERQDGAAALRALYGIGPENTSDDELEALGRLELDSPDGREKAEQIFRRLIERGRESDENWRGLVESLDGRWNEQYKALAGWIESEPKTDSVPLFVKIIELSRLRGEPAESLAWVIRGITHTLDDATFGPHAEELSKANQNYRKAFAGWKAAVKSIRGEEAALPLYFRIARWAAALGDGAEVSLSLRCAARLSGFTPHHRLWASEIYGACGRFEDAAESLALAREEFSAECGPHLLLQSIRFLSQASETRSQCGPLFKALGTMALEGSLGAQALALQVEYLRASNDWRGLTQLLASRGLDDPHLQRMRAEVLWEELCEPESSLVAWEAFIDAGGPIQTAIEGKTASLLALERHSEAFEIMGSVEGLEPESLEERVYRRAILAANHLPEKVVEAWHAWMMLAGDRPSAYVRVGQIFFERDLLHEADELLATGEDRFGSEGIWSGFNLRTRVLAHLERSPDVLLDRYEVAFDAGVLEPDGWQRYASLLRRLDDAVRLASCLEQMVTQCPSGLERDVLEEELAILYIDALHKAESGKTSLIRIREKRDLSREGALALATSLTEPSEEDERFGLLSDVYAGSDHDERVLAQLWALVDENETRAEHFVETLARAMSRDGLLLLRRGLFLETVERFHLSAEAAELISPLLPDRSQTGSEDWFVMHAELLFQSGQLDAAKDNLEFFLRGMPESLRGWSLLARVLEASQDFRGQRQALAAVAEYGGPREALEARLQALALYDTDDEEQRREARFHLEASLQAGPNPMQLGALLSHFENMVPVGDNATHCEAALESALKKSDSVVGRPLGYTMLAHLEQKRDKSSERGIALWRDVIDAGGDEALALRGIETAQYEQEDWTGLAETLESLVSLAGSTGQYDDLSALASLYEERLNDPGLALDALERCLVERPDDSASLSGIWRLALKREDWARAVEAGMRLIAVLTPRDSDDAVAILRRCANMLGEKLGRWEEATKAWEQLLGYRPTDRETLDALDSLYHHRGEHGRLISVLCRKVALGAGDQLELCSRIVNMTQGAGGQPALALEYARRAYGIAPQDPRVAERLRTVLTEQGEWRALYDNVEAQLHAGLGESDVSLWRLLGEIWQKAEKDQEEVFNTLLDGLRHTGDFDALWPFLLATAPEADGVGRIWDAGLEAASRFGDSRRVASGLLGIIAEWAPPRHLKVTASHLALKEVPSLPAALQILANESDAANDRIMALKELRALSVDREERLKIDERLARIFLYELDQAESALPFYEEVFTAAQRSSTAYEGFTAVLEKLDLTTRRHRVLEEWRTELPDSFPHIRAERLAREYVATGQLESAISVWTDLRGVDGYEEMALNALIQINEQLGNWVVWSQLYRERMPKLGREAKLDALGKLAEVLEVKISDTTGAIDAWTERLSLAPGDSHALRALHELCGAGKYTWQLAQVLGGPDERRPYLESLLKEPSDGLAVEAALALCSDFDLHEDAQRFLLSHYRATEDWAAVEIALQKMATQDEFREEALHGLQALYANQISNPEASARVMDELTAFAKDLGSHVPATIDALFAIGAIKRGVSLLVAHLDHVPQSLRAEFWSKALHAPALSIAEERAWRGDTCASAIVDTLDDDVFGPQADLLGVHLELRKNLVDAWERALSIAQSDKTRSALVLRLSGWLVTWSSDSEGAVSLLSRTWSSGLQTSSVARALLEMQSVDWPTKRECLEHCVMSSDGDERSMLELALAEHLACKDEHRARRIELLDGLSRGQTATPKIFDDLIEMLERDELYPVLLETIERRLELLPAREDLLRRAAELALDLGHASRAQDAYERLVHEFEGDAEAWTYLAAAYENQENWSGEASMLERLVQISAAENHEPGLRLAHLYDGPLGDSHRALRLWRELGMGTAPNLEAIEVLLHRLDEPSERFELAWRYIELAPANAGRRHSLLLWLLESGPKHLTIKAMGVLLDEGGHAASISEHLSKLVEDERFGDVVDALAYLDSRDAVQLEQRILWARILAYSLGRAPEAVIQARRVLSEDPTQNEVVAVIDDVLTRQRSWVELLDFWDERLAVEGSGAEQSTLCKRALKLAEDELRSPSRALQFALKGFELNANDALWGPEAERLCSILGNWEGAIDAWRLALDQTPQDAAIYHRRLGRWLGMAGTDPHLQRYHLEQAVQLGTRSLDDLRSLESLYASDPKRLVWCLDRMSELCDAHEARLLRIRSALLAEETLDDLNGARSRLQRVLADTPDDIEALEHLVRILRRIDDKPQLLMALHRLGRLSVGIPRQGLRIDQARLAEELGFDDQALGLWWTILEEEPDSPVALNSLESLSSRMGRWRTLAEVYERRMDGMSGKDLLDLQVQLADLWSHRLGDDGQALDIWKKVLEADSNHILALESCARLSPPDARAVYQWKLVSVYGNDEPARIELLRKLGRGGSGLESKRAWQFLLEVRDTDTEAKQALRILAEVEGDWRALDGGEPDVFQTVEALPSMVARSLGQRPVAELEASVERCESRLSAQPDDAHARKTLCRLLEELGAWGKLRDHLQSWFEQAEGVDAEHLALYAARVSEIHLNDAGGALGAIYAALEAGGDAEALAADVRRLTRPLGQEALEDAIGRWRREAAKRGERGAVLLVQAGRWMMTELADEGEARRCYEEALGLSPHDVEALRGLAGLEHAEPKQLAAALQNWLVHETDPIERQGAMLRLGVLQMRELEDLSAARETFESLQRVLPDNQVVRVNLASVYRRLGLNVELAHLLAERFEDAKGALRAELAVDIALIYQGEDDLDGAIYWWKRALSTGARTELVHSELLGLYEAAGEYEALSLLLQRMAEGATTAADVKSLTARFARLNEGALRNTATAISAWHRVLELEPADEEALSRLVALSPEPDANAYRWRLVEALPPTDPRRVGMLERLSLVEKGFGKRRVLELLHDLRPNDMASYRALEARLVDDGAWLELSELYSRRLAHGQASKEDLTKLADIRERHFGDLEGAAGALEAALAMDLQETQLRKELIRVHGEAASYGRQLALFEAHFENETDLDERLWAVDGANGVVLGDEDYRGAGLSWLLRDFELTTDDERLGPLCNRFASADDWRLIVTTWLKAAHDSDGDAFALSLRAARWAQRTPDLDDLAHEALSIAVGAAGASADKLRLLVPLSKGRPELEKSVWQALGQWGEPLEKMGAKLALGALLADQLNAPLEAEEIFRDVLARDPLHKEAVGRLESLYKAREAHTQLRHLFEMRAHHAIHPMEKRGWLEKALSAAENEGTSTNEKIALWSQWLDSGGSVDVGMTAIEQCADADDGNAWVTGVDAFEALLMGTRESSIRKRARQTLVAAYRKLDHQQSAWLHQESLVRMDPGNVSNLEILLDLCTTQQQRITTLSQLLQCELGSQKRLHVAEEAARLHQALGNTDDALSCWLTVYHASGSRASWDQVSRLSQLVEPRAVFLRRLAERAIETSDFELAEEAVADLSSLPCMPDVIALMSSLPLHFPKNSKLSWSIAQWMMSGGAREKAEEVLESWLGFQKEGQKPDALLRVAQFFEVDGELSERSLDCRLAAIKIQQRLGSGAAGLRQYASSEPSCSRLVHGILEFIDDLEASVQADFIEALYEWVGNGSPYAEKLLNRIEILSPDHPDVLQRALERCRTAQNHALKASIIGRLRPQVDHETWLALGMELASSYEQALERPDKALGLIHEMIERSGDSKAFDAIRLRLLRQSAEGEELFLALSARRERSEGRDRYDLSLEMAPIAERLGRMAEARELWEEIRDTPGKGAPAWGPLQRIYEGEEDWAALGSLFGRLAALTDEKHRVSLYLEASEAWLRAGDAEKARSMMRAAAEVAPHNVDALLGLAAFRREDKDSNGELGLLWQAFIGTPDKCGFDVLERLGQLAWENDQRERAAKVWFSLLRRLPEVGWPQQLARSTECVGDDGRKAWYFAAIEIAGMMQSPSLAFLEECARLARGWEEWQMAADFLGLIIDDGQGQAHHRENQVHCFRAIENWRALSEALLSWASVSPPTSQGRWTLLKEGVEVLGLCLGDVPTAFEKAISSFGECGLDSVFGDLIAHLADELDAWPAVCTAYRRHVESDETIVNEGTACRVRLGIALTEKLNDPVGAYVQYRAILGEDANASAALAALEDALSGSKQWSVLADALRRRIEVTAVPALRRPLLVRLARLEADALDDENAAMASWQRAYRLEMDAESRQQVIRLAGRTQKWSEYAAMLSSEGGSGNELMKAADLYRTELNAPDQAVAVLKRALLIDEVRDDALLSLEQSYTALEAWDDLDALLTEMGQSQEGGQLRQTLTRQAALRRDLLGDITGAEACLEMCLKCFPNDVEVLDALTASLQNREAYEQLAECYERYLSGLRGPDYGRHSLAWAMTLSERLGRPLEAIHCLEALEDGARDMACLELMVSLYRGVGQWARCAGLLEVLAERAEQTREIAAFLGEAASIRFQQLGQGEAALDLAREAWRLDVDSIVSFERAHRLVLECGSLSAWVDELVGQVAGIRNRDTHASALRALIRALFSLDREAEAEPWIRRILEDIDSEDANALADLDRILDRQERWDELVDVVVLRIRIDYEPGLILRAAELYGLRLGDPEKAVYWLRHHLEREPEDVAAWRELCRMESLNGHVRAEVDALGKLEQLLPSGSLLNETRVRRARLLSGPAGNRQAAVAAWKKVLREGQDEIEALDALERLMGEHESPAVLLALLQRRIALDPDNVETQRRAARLREACNELFQAVEHWRRVLEHQPNDLEALWAVFSASLDEHERVSARRGLLSVLTSDHPRYWELLEREASHLDDSEAFASSVTLWLSLLDDPESRLRARSKVIDCYTHLNDRRGLAEFLCGRGLAPLEGGKIFLNELGDGERARQVFEQVLKENPGAREAESVLERIYQDGMLWADLVDLLRRRAHRTDDPDLRQRELRRIARIESTHLNESARAFADLLEAFEESADDALSGDLAELAERCGEWPRLLERFAYVAGRSQPAVAGPLLGRSADWRFRILGDLDGALGDYEKALAFEPSDVGNRTGFEALLLKAGRKTALYRSIEARVDMAESAAERAGHFVRLARLKESDGESQKDALAAWQRVLTADPSSNIALQALERIYEACSNWSGVLEVVDRRLANELDPAHKHALILRVGEIAHGLLGQPRLAIERVLSIPEGERDVRHWELLAQAYEGCGEWEDAVRSWERSILLRPLDEHRAEVSLRRGLLLHNELGMTDLAIDAISQAITDAPSIGHFSESTRQVLDLNQGWQRVANGLMGERDIAELSGPSRQCLALIYAEALKDSPDAAQFWASIRSSLDSQSFEGGLYAQWLEDQGRWRSLERLYGDWGQSPEHEEELDLIRAQALERAGAEWSTLAPFWGRVHAQNPEQVEARIRLWRNGGEDIRRNHEDFLLEHLSLNSSVRVEILKAQALRLLTEEEAANLWRQVLRIAPNDADALQGLEKCYRESGNASSARLVLDRRLERAETANEQVAILVEIGLLEWGRENLSAAEDAFRRAWEGGAGGEALQHYAEILERRGKLSAWRDVRLQIIRQMAPEELRLEGYLELVSALEERSASLVPALETALEAAKLFPSEPEVLQRLRSLAAKTGRWADVLRVMEQVRDGADKSLRMELDLEMAEVYLRSLDKPSEAERCLRRALSLDKGSPEALRLLEQILDTPGREGQLIEVLEQRLECTNSSHENARILRRKGFLHEGMDDLEYAIGSWREALRHEPQDVEAFESLNRHLRARQQWEELAALWRTRIENHPLNATIGWRIQLAELLRSRLDDFQGAMAMLAPVEAELTGHEHMAVAAEIHRDAEDWPGYVDALGRLAATLEGAAARDVLLEKARVERSVLNDAKSTKSSLLAAFEEDVSHRPTLSAMIAFAQDCEAPEMKMLALGRLAALSTETEERIAHLLTLGEVYESSLGDPGGALDCYARILEERPVHSEGLWRGARVELSRANWRSGFRYLEILEGRLETVSEARKLEILYAIARCAYELEDKAGAREHLGALLDLDGRHREGLGLALKLNLDGDEHEAALRHAKLQMLFYGSEMGGPERAEKHYLLGALNERMGLSNEAEECFRRALKEDPEHGRALRALGLATDGNIDEEDVEFALPALAESVEASSRAEDNDSTPADDDFIIMEDGVMVLEESDFSVESDRQDDSEDSTPGGDEES